MILFPVCESNIVAVIVYIQLTKEQLEKEENVSLPFAEG
jgi:hemerythrin-like domain-containing protein